ncbi:hypothetical protein [Paludisphaera borealis]|uniref:Uncharacterized protein n=1 Tax=Paludisphaera borealis TaxID=1387353 RepID=A0A1U7CXK6_9BACT|nr:hypothetical protein [Paludisphaera borealis]APW63665.1 hypothetical protein BSF38_05239 [Paludisphaera borealis]
MDSREQRGRFTVLDGAALVMGSAIASLHVLRVMRSGLSIAGWAMMVLTFTWLAVTATGPFLYVARRYIRRPPGYPAIGDRLWALLGLPWLLTAVLQSLSLGDRRDALVSITLMGGLAVASLIAVVEVWSTWVMVPPEQAEEVEAGPWTSRVGLILAIAWPIQCGLGMVVLG